MNELKKVFTNDELKMIGTKKLVDFINDNEMLVIENHEYHARGCLILNCVRDINTNELYASTITRTNSHEYTMAIEKILDYNNREMIIEIKKIYRNLMNDNQKFYENIEDFEKSEERLKAKKSYDYFEKNYIIERKDKLNEKMKLYIQNKIYERIYNQSFILKVTYENVKYIKEGYLGKTPLIKTYIIEYVHYGRINQLKLGGEHYIWKN